MSNPLFAPLYRMARRMLGRMESIERLSDRQFVTYCYDRFFGRSPNAEEMAAYTAGLARGMTRAEVLAKFLSTDYVETAMRTAQSPEQKEYVPAGHFGSVVPSAEDIAAATDYVVDLTDLPGIELRLAEQVALIESFKPYYDELPYLQPSPDRTLRYAADNRAFLLSDTILLNGMIRHFRPKRIVEIGCGNSSAVMLDTNGLFFDNQIELTFVDPYPQILEGMMRPGDKDLPTVDLKVLPVQKLPVTFFDRLEANDILFIDSSHVSKAGSDVNYLFFEVLPRLKPGVIVHVHDILYPFELPRAWLEEGRFWNEQYLLRAFLTHNNSYELLTISTQVVEYHREWIAEHMPELQQLGGCLWMRRVR